MPSLFATFTANRCICGHDIISHPTPLATAGNCIECAAGGNSGSVLHLFIPENEINNPGNPNGLGANIRGVFTKSDFNAMIIAGEPANVATAPNATGPARPPNGQRGG